MIKVIGQRMAHCAVASEGTYNMVQTDTCSHVTFEACDLTSNGVPTDKVSLTSTKRVGYLFYEANVGISMLKVNNQYDRKVYLYGIMPTNNNAIVNQEVIYKTELPTSGTFYKNQMLLRDSFVTGNSLGWACKSSGTLGTLSGITASTTANSYAVTVNSTTGLSVGTHISIVGVTGTKAIVYITGTTVYLSTVANASVSNAAVAYVAPTFEVISTQLGYRTGTATPSGSVTPSFVGEEYLDTSAVKWYKSTGLTNTDWVALN